MPDTKIARRSFAGGEITPEMFGRIDNVKNQTGLALCRNALVLPHGPATKRPGLAFVNLARFNKATRLIPFVFSATQSMVLEFGDQYIHFHTAGGTLLESALSVASIAGDVVTTTGAHGLTAGRRVFMSGVYYTVAATPSGTQLQLANIVTGAAAAPAGTTVSAVYVISSPYLEADLPNIRYVQDADVLTLTCPGYAPRELRRLGATNWQLTTPTLGQALGVPTGESATPTLGTGAPSLKNHHYKITAVFNNGQQESLPTNATGTAVNDLTLPGSYNTVNWTAPSGSPTSYRVYKAVNLSTRMYGYVGEVTGTSFIDDNITPDYSRQPPAEVLRLDTSGNYPTAVTYFEQRRVFAGTVNYPQGVYMTRTGTDSDLAYSNPSQQGDAIFLNIKAQQRNDILHLATLTDLLAFTASGVWRVYSNADGALLPTTAAARAQSYDGANRVAPITASNRVLFVENTGKRVRDIGYSNDSQGYTTDDRSILAPHLFNDYTLTDSTFQRNPDKVAWFVRSDGVLLSLTFLPEQQVFAWAQHTTDGAFESVCTVPESGEDVVYAVVRRTVLGQTWRTVERMASRSFATLGDSYFLDCGASYSGSPTTTITGLWWLAGRTVRVLADGGVLRNLTVSATGTLTLPTAASKVKVGLPFTTDVQTLPLYVEGMAAAGQGTLRNIVEAYFSLYRTGVLEVGNSEATLREVPARTNEPWDSPPRLKSEDVDALLDPDWTRQGQVWLRSQDPVPFTLTALTLKVSLAG